jgi:hypothetical protein
MIKQKFYKELIEWNPQSLTKNIYISFTQIKLIPTNIIYNIKQKLMITHAR